VEWRGKEKSKKKDKERTKVGVIEAEGRGIAFEKH